MDTTLLGMHALGWLCIPAAAMLLSAVGKRMNMAVSMSDEQPIRSENWQRGPGQFGNCVDAAESSPGLKSTTHELAPLFFSLNYNERRRSIFIEKKERGLGDR